MTIMVDIHNEYLSAGGNRHPEAADWDIATGVFAYGADRNIALWLPLVFICAFMEWNHHSQLIL